MAGALGADWPNQIVLSRQAGRRHTSWLASLTLNQLWGSLEQTEPENPEGWNRRFFLAEGSLILYWECYLLCGPLR